LRIIEQGRTDSPDSTSLYVPSIGLIVAGDVVYNQCRMYVGDTTPESRKNWIAALDRLAALNPVMVVAGHKKPGAPDSPSTIQDTKRYLEDFDRVQKTASRPGAVRSDDETVSALGSQSVVVDVWISGGITHIRRFKVDVTQQRLGGKGARENPGTLRALNQLKRSLHANDYHQGRR